MRPETCPARVLQSQSAAIGNPSQGRRQSGGGFSLIELLAIIVIVVLLAGVAAPSIAAMSQSRAKMAARHLHRDMTFARQRAIATGTRSWVVFNTGAETWSILAENPSSPGRSNAVVLRDDATNAPFTQTLGVGSFVGVQIVSASFDGNVEVGFDWLGRPLNSSEANLAAQGTVVLTGNNQLTVEVGTGHVRYIAP